jgi:hypothetical protein
MKLKRRLRLQKQTLRFLLDKDLALAQGGATTDSRDGAQTSSNDNPCETNPCIAGI